LEKPNRRVSQKRYQGKDICFDDRLENKIEHLLASIQSNLFLKAKTFREENTYEVNDYKEFKKSLEEKGGFIRAYWDGTSETELKNQGRNESYHQGHTYQ